jgi:hypothetical protein
VEHQLFMVVVDQVEIILVVQVVEQVVVEVGHHQIILELRILAVVVVVEMALLEDIEVVVMVVLELLKSHFSHNSIIKIIIE